MNNRKLSETNPRKTIKKMAQENAERDELGYAVSWKRAFSQIYNLTSWLQSYCSIISLACQKIFKKFDKVMLELGIENASLKLNEYILTSDITIGIQGVIQLRKNINSYYKELFDGDKTNAESNELEQRMKGQRSKDAILISFFSGIVLTLIFCLIIINYFPGISFIYFLESTKFTEDSISHFFPAFNFYFILILLLIGLGINIIILRKYRINYIFIFEIDPKVRMGHQQIFRV